MTFDTEEQFRQDYLAYCEQDEDISREFSELPKRFFLGLVERDLLVYKLAKTGDSPPRKMWVGENAYQQWRMDGFKIKYPRGGAS